MPKPRNGLRFVSVPSGHIYAIGGSNEDKYYKNVGRYNPMIAKIGFILEPNANIFLAFFQKRIV